MECWKTSVARSDASATAEGSLYREFQAKGYAKLSRNHVPLSDATIAFLAMYFNAAHEAGEFYRDSKEDPSALLSASRWSLDGDRLADHLATLLRPGAEEAFGAALKLGFSKVAIYEAEAELAAHRDQILNEVSITLVLEDTAHGASSPSWPLELLRPPEEAVFDKDWHVVSLHAAIGEALLFRGRDFLHSRPCCLGRGQRSLVLLLHYVPASFPEYHCVTLVNVSTSTVDELLNYQCSTVISPELHEAKLAGERPAQQPPVGITTPDPRTRRYRRYMLYNPCATNFDPSYCQSQFNNQVVFFLHALSVAKCLGRTLVLPPFMWMEHQMAETQHWFPFEHFFDLQTLKARFDVIPLEEFLDAEGLRQPGGKKLQWYLYPPYMVNDAPFAFRGLFFEKYMNLSFAMPKRMSPFWEARMGKSGRGEEPFRANEGHSYWTAVRLLLGKLRAESSQLHSKEMKEDSWFARWIPGAPMEQKEAALIARQSEEVEQMKASLGSLNLGPEVHPIEDGDEGDEKAPDILVFDFAPSYNFRFEHFDFDWELRRNRRAVRFSQRWRQMAETLQLELGQRYVALHLRRDGYQHFCRSEDGRSGRAPKLRFGFPVSMAVCHANEESATNGL